jgi:hypothetical protein
MSQPTATQKPARSEADRRKLRHVAGAVGLVVAVGALALFVMHKKSQAPAPPSPAAVDERLQAAVAEADRLDPRWHFAELEQDRAAVPADLNAAPLVVASHILIPKELNRLEPDVERDRLRRAPPVKNPREPLESAAALFFEARQLANFSRGRHAVEWNLKDPLLTPLTHVWTTRDIVDLLTLDAEVSAHEDKIDQALLSVRAALVAAATIGDEPMLISQLQRPGWADYSVQALEQTLRRGQGSTDTLLKVQMALEEEEAAPVLLTTARGERAGLHALMTAVENGEVPTARQPVLGDQRAEGVTLLQKRQRAYQEGVHAWLLEYSNRFVAIARLPSPEQAAPLKELLDSTVQAPPGAMPLLAGVSAVDVGQTCHKSQALLRCAAAGIAVERYRLANGRWPDDLDQLTPKYLAQVPTDPFDGKPLRYVKLLKGGVIVYSVGPGGKERGKPDDLDKFERKNGSDLGFRLWNVEARIKPAK